MNINNYITTISNLNLLIESLTNQDIDNVQKSIDATKERLDALDAEIDSQLNMSNISNIPYKKTRIEFFNTIKTSVRESTEKYEIELSGREDLDVVGFDEIEKFIVVRKSKWKHKIALIIEYSTIETRREQKGELQLFYNEYGNLSGYNKTRGGIKEDFKFQFISID